jgi:uncharacterized protein (TIGR02996 family)
MTSEEGFLQDIREHPEDDTPRLIFADWLEENDRPGRAEFIRVGCALAKMPDGAHGWRALWKRELELIIQHKDAWWTVFRTQCRYWDCRRGFAHEAWINADQFLQHTHEMFLEPIHTLILHEVTREQIPGLAVGPYLGWVKDLHLRGTSLTALRGDDVRVLLGCSNPGGIPGKAARNPDPKKPSRHPTAPAYRVELNTLDLGDQEIGTSGVEAILSAPGAARLRKLDLSGRSSRTEDGRWLGTPNIGPDGLHLLVTSPKTANLVALDLSGNRLRSPEARALVESPYLAALMKLELGRNDFDEESSLLLRERFGERVRL